MARKDPAASDEAIQYKGYLIDCKEEWKYLGDYAAPPLLLAFFASKQEKRL